MNGRVYVILSDQKYYGRVYTRKSAETARRKLETMGHDVIVQPCENSRDADAVMEAYQ